VSRGVGVSRVVNGLNSDLIIVSGGSWRFGLKLMR